MVLATDGLYSFGRNDFGQLGCSARISKEDWGVFKKTPQEVSGSARGEIRVRAALDENRFFVMRTGSS